MCRTGGTGAGGVAGVRKLNGMRNCCKLCLSLVCYSVRDRVRFGLHGSASSDREITCTSHNHKTACRDILCFSTRCISSNEDSLLSAWIRTFHECYSICVTSGLFKRDFSKKTELFSTPPRLEDIFRINASRFASWLICTRIRGEARINRTPPLISFFSLPG